MLAISLCPEMANAVVDEVVGDERGGKVEKDEGQGRESGGISRGADPRVHIVSGQSEETGQPGGTGAGPGHIAKTVKGALASEAERDAFGFALLLL